MPRLVSVCTLLCLLVLVAAGFADAEPLAVGDPVAAGTAISGANRIGGDSVAFTGTIAPNEGSETFAIDNYDRQAVIDAYLWEYRWLLDDVPGIREAAIEWTGSVTECDPGTISADNLDQATTAINYFRSMAGLGSVTLDARNNRMSQAAALIMEANMALSHEPGPSWDCWTEDGAEGATNSNLGIGPNSVRRIIEYYMDDFGASNTAVGHRRWLLAPGADTFGFGATNLASAIWVTQDNYDLPPGTPNWITFPTAGFWPEELVTNRWSLSDAYNVADFSGADVAMTHGTDRIEIVVHDPAVPAYGYQTAIVWDIIDGRFPGLIASSGDATFEVEITGVLIDHETVDHTYSVTFVDAMPPAMWDTKDNPFSRDIVFIRWRGITKGCNPPANTQYCATDDVTRGQMAAFLVRALGLTDEGDGDLFSDDDGSVFEASIDKLATAGITKGCNPPVNDMYCPNDPVTRGQMAAFLVRALGYTDNGGGNLFTDDDGNIFETSIDKLATAGVTRGCDPPVNDMFCPHSNVTRGQMAAFLHRALG